MKQLLLCLAVLACASQARAQYYYHDSYSDHYDPHCYHHDYYYVAPLVVELPDPVRVLEAQQFARGEWQKYYAARAAYKQAIGRDKRARRAEEAEMRRAYHHKTKKKPSPFKLGGPRLAEDKSP